MDINNSSIILIALNYVGITTQLYQHFIVRENQKPHLRNILVQKSHEVCTIFFFTPRHLDMCGFYLIYPNQRNKILFTFTFYFDSTVQYKRQMYSSITTGRKHVTVQFHYNRLSYECTNMHSSHYPGLCDKH